MHKFLSKLIFNESKLGNVFMRKLGENFYQIIFIIFAL